VSNSSSVDDLQAKANHSRGVDGIPSHEARRDLLLWSAFALAFSPLLFDLFAHLRARPWANYGLLFLVLLIAHTWHERSRAAAHHDGYLLLSLALMLQCVAVGGGFTRWGRLALPLGVMGLARLLGRPSPRVAALAFWAVPLPNFIASIASPRLEQIWLMAAAWLLSPLAPIAVEGTTAATPGGMLTFDAVSGGLPLAALLSGLGWLRALDDWRGLGSALRTASTWGLAALPLQALCALAALALATLGAPALASAWLSWGIFLVVGAAGLVIVHRSRRSGHE